MNTEILLARAGERNPRNLDEVVLDVPRLFRRLLTFDSYILDAALRLRDVASSVHAIGIDNACRLLQDGGLRLNVFDAYLAYPTSSSDAQSLRYRFVLAKHADYAAHARESILELSRLDGHKNRKRARLGALARRALVDAPNHATFGTSALRQLTVDLRDDWLARQAIQLEMTTRRG